MINLTQVYDYYCIINRGRLISNAVKYADNGGRAPKPSIEPAVGTIEFIEVGDDEGTIIHHDRFTTKLTKFEYEQIWGIDGLPAQLKAVIIRSAYKIINGTEYDVVLAPVFLELLPYLPDIITYDNQGNEVSRRTPIEGESYISGYAGTDPINV